MERPGIVTEKTLVPMGALVFVFWLGMCVSTISRQSESYAAQISEIKSDVAHNEEEDLARQRRSFDILSGKVDKTNDKLDKLILEIKKK